MSVIDTLENAGSSLSDGICEDHVEDALDSVSDALDDASDLAAQATDVVGANPVSQFITGVTNVVDKVQNVVDGLTTDMPTQLPWALYEFSKGTPKDYSEGNIIDQVGGMRGLAHMADNAIGMAGGPTGLVKTAAGALGLDSDSDAEPQEWFVHDFECVEAINELFSIKVILVRKEGIAGTSIDPNDTDSNSLDALKGDDAGKGYCPLCRKWYPLPATGGSPPDCPNHPGTQLQDPDNNILGLPMNRVRGGANLVSDVINDFKNKGPGSDQSLLEDVINPRNAAEQFFSTKFDKAPCDPADFLNATCSVHVVRKTEDGMTVVDRWFTGICNEYEDLGYTDDIKRIKLSIVPSLWKLGLRSNCRIFEQMTAMQIVRKVIQDDAGLYPGSSYKTLGPKKFVLFGGASDDQWGPKREYCVQYNETDLEFVTRLLAEEGVSFFFQHHDRFEQLVLADNAKATGYKAKTVDKKPVPSYDGVDPNLNPIETYWGMAGAQRIIPTKFTLRDFNLSVPDSNTQSLAGHGLEEIVSGANLLDAGKELVGGLVDKALGGGEQDYGDDAEVYEYASRLTMEPDADNDWNQARYKRYNGPDVAKFLLKYHRSQENSGHASSNIVTLMAGGAVRLQWNDHKIVWNLPQLRQRQKGEKFIITRAFHLGKVDPTAANERTRMAQAGLLHSQMPPVDPTDEHLETPPDYLNQFSCIRSKTTPFKPPPRPPKPVIGLQTATVVDQSDTRFYEPDSGAPTGAGTDPVFVDPLGRIKVRFHWDRNFDPANENQSTAHSCWVRVSGALAGAHWGSMFLPRVGSEVVVAFLEGDPDRPVIIGSVHNIQNFPPHRLPRNKTVSGIVTQSIPIVDEAVDSVRHNEITFEDAGGKEELRIRAQRDMREQIERDHSTEIGKADPPDSETATHYFQKNEVWGPQDEKVCENQTLTVHGKTELLAGNSDALPPESTDASKIHASREKLVDGSEAIVVGRAADSAKNVSERKGSRTLTVDDNDTLDIRGCRREDVTGNDRVEVKGQGERKKADPPDRSEDDPDESVVLKVYGHNQVHVTKVDVLEVAGDRNVVVKKSYTIDAQQMTMGSGDVSDPKRSALTTDDHGFHAVGKRSVAIKGDTTELLTEKGDIEMFAPHQIRMHDGKDETNSLTLDGDEKTLTLRSMKDGIRLGWNDHFVQLTSTGLQMIAKSSGQSAGLAVAKDGDQYNLTMLSGATLTLNFSDEIHFDGDDDVSLGEPTMQLDQDPPDHGAPPQLLAEHDGAGSLDGWHDDFKSESDKDDFGKLGMSDPQGHKQLEDHHDDFKYKPPPMLPHGQSGSGNGSPPSPPNAPPTQ